MAKTRSKSSPAKKKATRRKAVAKKTSSRAKHAPAPHEPILSAGLDAMPLTKSKRGQLVFAAIERMRGAHKRGSRSTAWKLDESILIEAAMRNILNQETQTDIVEWAREWLEDAKVSEDAFVRWMRAVYTTYWTMYREVVQRESVELDAIGAISDPHAMAEKFLAMMMALAVYEMDLKRWQGHTVNGKHVVVRILECVVKAPQLLADSRAKDATARKIERSLAALESSVKTGIAKGNIDPAALATAARVLAGLEPSMSATGEQKEAA